MLRNPSYAAALLGLLLCAALPSTYTSAQPDTATTAAGVVDPATNASSPNYSCPTDCHCVLALNTHKPFLHARCSSIDGLLSEEPLLATLPVHSVDLSFLKLTRLSHALDKLRDLTSVDLSHNELHEIGHLGRRIKKLNLKHNRITSAKLSKLPQHVQTLNLQHNDISYLPLEFTKLTHLQTLELSHNHINCSCETLEVRNWLQERHVFMESPVTCSHPAEYKGKSWLQLKQAEVCEKEQRGSYSGEDENELMLGDQPVEGSGDNDEEDELGRAYIPIEHATNSAAKSAELKWHDVEGSGDLGEMSLPMELRMTTEEPPLLRLHAQEQSSTAAAAVAAEEEQETDDDGSGSGGGMFFIPQLARERLVPDDFDAPDSTESHNDDDSFDNRPVEQPATEAAHSPHIFGAGMGIFDDANKGTAQTDGPVQEEPIVPVVQHMDMAGNIPDEEVSTAGTDDADDDDDGDFKSDAIKTAKMGKEDDSNATYFLLGVIVLIVIGLILYVGIKRCKQHRNAAHDAENPRQTELLDMDKKHPGKPLLRNGNEHAPLIGDQTKSDLAKPINGAGAKKAYEASDVKDGPAQQQPLLNSSSNGNGAKPAEHESLAKSNAPSANELAPHEYYPITPRYPTPKSPRASKYAQHPQGEPNNNNNNNNSTADDAYLPSSPKGGRYSPVYSPETGRVKIKLTETPRPKTPMLVTRSRSNAGDIITTPVHAAQAPPVVAAVNGHMSH